MTYSAAGVDIDAGNELVNRIRPAVEATRRPEVLGGIGGFGGLVELPSGYNRPVMVAGTDGVGTKLRLAIETGQHSGIGADLVAMCANDVVVQGAEPLFFLDYYATGKLDIDTAQAVIEGIAAGCREAGAALLGGETAEMPGIYSGEDYDLAGFCVGIVERSELIEGTTISPGDALIALPSSGPHANGYSLIRRILDQHPNPQAEQVAGAPLLDLLLEPTRIYVGTVLDLLAKFPIKGLAHITGGGLPENLPRMLPASCSANLEGWQWPEIFHWLAKAGNIETSEMLRTFNCGVGFVICVKATDLELALEHLNNNDIPAWQLGVITEYDNDHGTRLKIDGVAV
ncbi:phosphoribosylformylglycinamidine cyclo-ligase [Halorhodospira halochloris]|uniref:phosphoribosylformylglycinamidine cyclo-ligase n=1 Tax=Halorhodospira halochloris TaxID=1052 RepID=UPI001EE99AE5|nr:phosphoribosylformylglycinamidine cyclo-ligase [Halorhodospira halochloris]MCG5548787.1 phosphoribosylformylglycinamidine cyclo-ligase [Halorhodospira halochloris]